MKRSIVSGLSGLLLGGALWAAPATPIADKEKIVALVGQLGSNSFRERESAMRELEALGEPALDKLREATKSTDPEVVTRATKLVERIGVKVRTAKLLSPTAVELDLRNATVKEALAELSKQSGYDVLCPSSRTEKRITLKTGRVPFMRALELVCQQADLVEETVAASPTRPRTTTIRGGVIQPQVMPVAPIQLIRPAPVPIQVQIAPIQVAPPAKVEEAPAPKVKPDAPKLEAPKLEAPKLEAPKLEVPKLEVPKPPVAPPVAPPVMVAPPIRFQQIELTPIAPPVFAEPSSRSRIVLKEGKAEIYPSHIEGPVRISLRPESAMKLPPAPVNAEAPLYLVVEAEPKFPMVAIAGVTIKKAIDDQNQNLVRVTTATGNAVNDVEVINRANVQRLQLQLAEARNLASRGGNGLRSWPVMFQKAEKASKSLAEVSGTVSVSVQMPTANVVEIDLDKDGKGKGESKVGATVEILGVSKNADGSYSLELSTTTGQQNGPVRGNIIVQGGGRILIDGDETSSSRGVSGMALQDKDGNALQHTGNSQQSVSLNGTTMVSRTRMNFKPTGKSGEPVRFVQTGNTVETIEIPFSLKDVPLK